MAILPKPVVSKSEKTASPQMNRIRALLSPSYIHDNAHNQKYAGKGTFDDPYIVDYLHNDLQDAMNFSKSLKWTIVVLQSLSMLVVTFASSVYASGIRGVQKSFDVSEAVAILGLSLYVLGFALGPLLWGPLSEMYGRKSIYVISFTGFTAFSVAAAFSPNITALLVLRFFASACGSSTLTNAGGVVADLFITKERGLAMMWFVLPPFLGPAFGPIIGGFLAQTEGWRWILYLIAICASVVWIITILTLRETYAPYILRCRARALSRTTTSLYVCRVDAGKAPKRLSEELRIALTRPWILLFCEPIVLLTSMYLSIVYGTLYMFFAGFPIVFEITRGWSQGIAGLPFVGVAIGVLLATVAAGIANKRYVRLLAAAEARGGKVEPEARLTSAMVASIILPIGMFLFAWTTYPSVPWIAPVIGATIFACGFVMVFVSLVSYLIDSYVVYAASVMAASTMLRSLFATAFPLFTPAMYDSLGDQWASSVPAFLLLGCPPFPFVFYKYGPKIRSKCKYASEAAKVLEMMRQRHGPVSGVSPESDAVVGEFVPGEELRDEEMDV